MKFGDSVSFDDGRGFVGSPYDSEAEVKAGAIHLLERSGDSWVEQAKIHAPDHDRNDGFGANVVLRGDQVLVSAHADDEAGDNKGAGYVYRRTAPGNWVLEQKLLPSYSETWFSAGIAADLHGDIAVLGGLHNWQGLVFVFERTANGWIQTAVLKDPTPQDHDDFGHAVAVEDDVIAIGEPIDDNDSFRSGSVFVFERTGPPPGNWTLTQELKASNKAKYDQFGYAVDLHEGRLLVGARWGRVEGKKRGTAYIFEPEGGVWQETAMLAPSEVPKDNSDLSQFGTSVSHDPRHREPCRRSRRPGPVGRGGESFSRSPCLRASQEARLC